MNSRIALFAGLTLCLMGSARAHDAPEPQRMLEAITAAQTKVTTATEALNALRTTQTQQRTPRVAELEALTHEAETLRKRVATLRAAKDQSAQQAASLKRDIETLTAAQSFTRTLLKEYRRSFETRNSVAESSHLSPSLDTIDANLAQTEDPKAFEAGVTALFTLAESWARQRLGGTSFDGDSIAEDGISHHGRFAVVGPLTYFSPDDTTVPAGRIVSRVGSSLPGLVPTSSPEDAGAIAQLAKGQQADLPIDPSGGDAFTLATKKVSFQQHLINGGAVMIPLLAIALIAIVLTLSKMFALVRIKIPREAQLDAIATHIRAGQYTEAQACINALGAPFNTVLSAGIEYRDLADGHLEEILQERALATLPSLDRHLGILAVLGGVAPLLGLLGTVTGMIRTFELVTLFGSGDARMLSGGISEALITTETGLIIAVPILLVHALLNRRVRTIVAALEQTAIGFMNRLHQEADHA